LVFLKERRRRKKRERKKEEEEDRWGVGGRSGEGGQVAGVERRILI